ncbi:hypothetical protein CJ030_MR1G028611 [Morella rubra]|uniref:F-box domain-containing protein n=1 Tax=Morella rubra TaxID=262757 RepID=A0A6A1WHR5_9ROSI|nr:hypothetical protein CJ030_MR1G028611 [Morella rubra]
MSTKNLPDDVIVEILLRLPIKYVAQFRCASKQWRSLISDRRFARSHFLRASGHTQRLLLSNTFGLGSIDIHEPFGDGLAVREVNFPFQQPGRLIRIVGSCDGLVCLSLFPNIDFYIWNPCTGDHTRLPDLNISLPNCKIYIHGFGYDSCTDDYKLLVAAYIKPETQVEVFSMRRNSWKRIQGLDNPIDSYATAGILCNGALHWQPDWADQRRTITAFDLAQEKFRQLPMPMPMEQHVAVYLGNLRNVEGHLCLTGYTALDIWLWKMKEYGVQESWAPMFRIACLYIYVPDTELTPVTSLSSLCFPRIGQLLAIHNGKKLIKCYSGEETVESFVACGRGISEATLYVESLLSPACYNGNDGQLFSE